MIMVEVQPKYNLRSKSKPASDNQPKKILPRGKTYEPTQEETTLSNNKTKVVNTLDPEAKKFETQTKGTDATNTNTPLTKAKSNKSVQTNTLEKKCSKVTSKELDKAGGDFIFKNEINKIKIQIPLVELVKNPAYRKQITKVIGVSEPESQSDVLNLEDDKPNITFGTHF